MRKGRSRRRSSRSRADGSDGRMWRRRSFRPRAEGRERRRRRGLSPWSRSKGTRRGRYIRSEPRLRAKRSTAPTSRRIRLGLIVVRLFLGLSGFRMTYRLRPRALPLRATLKMAASQNGARLLSLTFLRSIHWVSTTLKTWRHLSRHRSCAIGTWSSSPPTSLIIGSCRFVPHYPSGTHPKMF